MRKPEWLFVIAILLVGAYFSFRYFTKSEKLDPLQLVPASAAIVYEVSDPLKIYTNLKTTDLWQGIKDMPGAKQSDKVIEAFDSLTKENSRLERALNSGKTLISLHITGNESAGLMYYLPTGPATGAMIEDVIKQTYGKKATKHTRVYDSYSITELRIKNNVLSYILVDNYIVLSNYGYLNEDVVRNINDDFSNGLFVKHANLYSLPKLGNDQGNLYLNGDLLTSLANTFLPPLENIKKKLASSGYLDVSISRSKIFLSGFFYENRAGSITSLFNDQEAGQSEVINLVSENVAQVTLINVSNVNKWYDSWAPAFGVTSGFENSLARFLQGDMVLSSFYSTTESPDKLFIAKLRDKEGALNHLNRKAEEIASAKEDTVYFESYADLDIGLIETNDFVAAEFGSPFEGFEVTYFTTYNNFLVLASSSERIKQWLNDIDLDLVWSRSVEKSEFIDNNLKETSFAVIYSNPWSYSFFNKTFNESFNKWWTHNEPQIKQFGLLSFQFANLDNRFYSEIKLEYNPQQVYVAQQQFSEELLTQMTGQLITKPKLVRNHTNNQWEVLIQDSATFLSLLNEKGELLWSDSLAERIVSEIYQVDFYKNRKLQYLFASNKAVHIVDRNGDEIEGYPKSFSKGSIDKLFLLDYDKSRNYRYLLADKSGSLYMMNTQGELLEGWNPLAINSELSDQIFHVRVRGKDRIVIAQKNGIVGLRNRRGETESGFPIDLEFNLDNPIHFKAGSTFGASRFTTLSKEGILVEFDLLGNEHTRKQVNEPSESAEFSLVIDVARNDMIIAKQDVNRLTIIDKDGSEFFEKDFRAANQLEVQYYYFGVDRRLYIVRDTVTGQLYLYNKNGNVVNEGELYSDYPVSVVYHKKESKCYLYTSNNQSVEIKSFAF